MTFSTLLAAGVKAMAFNLALTTGTLAAAAPLSIVVYDQPGFKGRALAIDRAIPDLAALQFDDEIASFEIRGAGDWILCEHRNYGGRCVRVQAKAEDLKVLQIGGRVSSLYPAPAPAAPTP
jgi:Beta/Gamma crystallin